MKGREESVVVGITSQEEINNQLIDMRETTSENENG